MPANKNALIRYKAIDNCLRFKEKCTLQDLVDACSEALYRYDDYDRISVRTVQGDIEFMRSDKLGYNAPIEVYNRKYYRYADENYSIMKMQMSQNDYEVMQKAVDMLREFEDFEQFSDMADVVRRLQDKLAISRTNRKPIIHIDSVPYPKGLRLLNPLYNQIAHKHTLRIMYQSFNAEEPTEFILCPYLLKEFRSRWFLYGSDASSLQLYNLPLDRIVSIEQSEKPYRYNPDFDPEHFFDDLIGVTKNINDQPTTIKFWATAEQSKYLKTKPVHLSQKLIEENPKDGTCIFSINVVVNYEMYSILLSYGSGIKIISPRECVECMQEKLKQARKLYEPDNETQIVS